MTMTHARACGGKKGVEVGALLTSILIIATCALIYELIIGSLSSYLLGDTVFQFSLTIGVFLTAMGIGSFLSRLVGKDLLLVFLLAEIAIALVGGVSAAALFGVFVFLRRSYLVILIAVIVLLGALIGLEIPLLTRIARRYGSLRDTLANVLAFDYLGALVASLLFPLVFLPYLGVIKTSFLVGLLNLLVVGINLRVFGRGLPQRRAVTLATALVAVGLAAGFWQAAAATSVLEHSMYQDPIIYSEQSPYQRIIVTRYQDDVRLYLDKELQFSTRDEYRYHESLVHPAMSLAPSRERVLVIGGGDGLVIREVLKYPDVQEAILVDIDPAMTRLGRTFGPIVDFNHDALNDPRVQIVNADGFKFLENSSDLYGVIISDLPDPRTEALAKLYSLEFYTLIKRHLAKGGMFAAQASSPYFVRSAYWCMMHTAAAGGLNVRTYHTYIPSFGDWGFLLASDLNFDWSSLRLRLVPGSKGGMRFLNGEVLAKMTLFDPDSSEVPTDVSTLYNPSILRYYMAGVQRWRG